MLHGRGTWVTVSGLRTQWREFHQTLFDDVVEATDDWVLKAEGSRSRSPQGQIFEWAIVVSKYHLVIRMTELFVLYWYILLTYIFTFLILSSSGLRFPVFSAERHTWPVASFALKVLVKVCKLDSELLFDALFYSSQVLFLFNTSWTGFTGSQSALGMTSKSPLWLTRLLSSGHPAYLRELISPYQPSRSLRSSRQLLLTVPRANLTSGERAFSYSSPIIWNVIPLSARDAPSISTFKRHSFIS